MKRGIYLFPSVFTLANLAGGVYSIFASLNGHFIWAANLILISCLLDVFDGFVARLFKVDSRFGIEFDSLADLVSFGVAPAILMYEFKLNSYGKTGLILGFIFIACGAIRLARFNSKAEEDVPTMYYEGLPIPVPAAILASFVLAWGVFNRDIRTYPVFRNYMPWFYRSIPVSMLILGYLMVSRIRYTSFKKLLKPTKRITFRFFFWLVAVFLIIWRYPENTIFLFILVYILAGLFEVLLRTCSVKAKRIIIKERNNENK